MSDRLHIIITSDQGKARSLLFSKRRLQLTCLITVSLFIILSSISYKAFHFSNSNTELNNQITTLNKQLQENKLLKESLALQVEKLQQLNSSQAEHFQEEKATLLNTAVSELEERSGIIERIIGKIGVDINDIPQDNNNSGGPFIAPRETIGRELLFRSDHYLDTISSLPLGRPIPGLVTSRFGHRTDPVNGKKGFHSGVDMRGPSGQKIIATADGIVTKAFFNGSYGKYIEISHGNGYTTKFAHMKKLLVKRGEKVKRGQPIGTVGNSGRSTGTHLHYEICLYKKPINPSKYMRVDKLVEKPVIPRLTAQSHRKIKHQLIVKKQISAAAPLEN